MTSERCPAIDFMRCKGIEEDCAPFPLTISGAYASDSAMAMPTMYSSLTVTRWRCDMGYRNTGRQNTRPTHPGEMLREGFMPDYGLATACGGLLFEERGTVLRRGVAVRRDGLLRQAGSDSMFEFFTADGPAEWGDSVYVQVLLAQPECVRAGADHVFASDHPV